jgi:hypothetical protein
VLDYNDSQRLVSRPTGVIALSPKDRTARLAALIEHRKKRLNRVFERLCAKEDATPSQIVCQLIRRSIEERTGRLWSPEDAAAGHRAAASSDESADSKALRHLAAR